MKSVLLARAVGLVLAAQLLAWVAAPVSAAPRYEYTFENLKAKVEERVNVVAGLGWEVFDVAFTNLSGYLICYRRLVPQGTPKATYAFDLATYDNAQEKANQAAKNGWELYRLMSCAGKLYCLVYHRATGPQYTYEFQRSVGQKLTIDANQAAQKGWELLDVGFGDMSGYLLCYRRAPKNTPLYTYDFATPRGADIESAANERGKQGWELLNIVPCTQNLYCLSFRKSPTNHYLYRFERAAGANIESKADAAVKDGWEVYRVVGDSPGDIDFAEAADLLRSSVPYMVCYRR